MGNRPKIDIINVLSYVLSVLIGISAILTAAWVIAEGKYVLLNLLILTMLTIASVALYLFMTYRLGSKDKLTGAMNIYTLQRYAMTLAVTRRISQFTGIFLNIKNFKYINRTIGYNNGDLVIKEYVKSIKSVLGKGEKIARLGGDNFLILCKQSHDTEILKMLERLKVTVDCDGKDTDVFVSARCGVYRLNAGDRMSELMNYSSIAYKRAYAKKESQVFFTVEMLEELMHINEVASLFDKALENHEFVIYYQPKVDMRTSTLCGCEALVRWIKSGEFVSPDEFVPVLENQGLVKKLDFYAFETVCTDIKKLLDSGINPVRTSVNFTKKHLNDSNFADNIIDMVKKYDVPTRYLDIEITESSGYDDYDALHDFVERMKKAHISVSIDDFGTGYSSLSLVKTIDANVIKFDKSFLVGVNDNTSREFMFVRNLMKTIRDLGYEIICEGVETKEQVELLLEAGCEMAQGYYYDKPLSLEDFTNRLNNRIYS